MLKPKLITPQRFIHQKSVIRGEEFGVLCWNTQKLTETLAFQIELARILRKYPTLFLLLQEAKLTLNSDSHFPEWSYAIAPNIQTKRSVFGVLTASQSAFNDAQPRLSTGREGMIATFKSHMISSHPLDHNQSLLIVNVHAINFVSAKYFLREMELLKLELQEHNGPLIVAGDFNVWSYQRRRYLQAFCDSIGLRQAYMSEPQHIKTYRQHPLDFIFYRDLWLKKATAIDTSTVSDHNPIYARFAV